MQTREIGRSGIQASVIGLGCNNFGLFQDSAQATVCVHAALDAGITFFDMASEHGKGLEEELVGAALGPRRKNVVIATKFGQQELIGIGPDGSMTMSDDETRRGASRRWIMQSVEESLRRLKTDYIDLYQIHAPDPDTPRDETLRAMDDLVRQGKVRAIGEASTFATADELTQSLQLQEAEGLARFQSMQTQYNLLVRDAEAVILPVLRQRNMSLLPYFPLASGLLTGKYTADARFPKGSRFDRLPMIRDFFASPVLWKRLEELRAFAETRGISLVQLAIGWLLAEPAVASVIAGATTPAQVAQNAAAASTVLSAADRAELLLQLSSTAAAG